jgi:hypothetical protein
MYQDYSNSAGADLRWRQLAGHVQHRCRYLPESAPRLREAIKTPDNLMYRAKTAGKTRINHEIVHAA